MSGYYEYRHTVETDETTLVGNVHFVNYLRWQSRCRERFLKEKAPTALAEDMRLHTVKAECEYFSEITTADDLSVRMRLEELTRTELQLTFDYVRVRADGENLAARGRQRVACLAVSKSETVDIPPPLRDALRPYAETPVSA